MDGAAGRGRGGVTRSRGRDKVGRRDKVEATRRDRGGRARSGYHKKGGGSAHRANRVNGE